MMSKGCLNRFLPWWHLKASKADFLFFDLGKKNDTLIMSLIQGTWACATLDSPFTVPAMKTREASRAARASREPGGPALYKTERFGTP